jgi:beta-N-acetylhexosaminidase
MEEDIIPFQKAVDVNVDAVMLGHLLLVDFPTSYPSLPASLNPYWINDILKKKLGYNGLIITDALNMRAVAAQYDSGDEAVAAFTAGADILLMPEDPRAGWRKISKLCETMPKLAEQLDKSVVKILKLKEQYGLLSPL